MRDLKQPNDKIDESTDKDTNTPPTHKRKIPSKIGTSRPPPGKERDESPGESRQPADRESGAPGGVPQMIQVDQMVEMMVMMMMKMM